MTDLHAQIMNLPCKYEAAWQTPAPSDWVEGYVNGHRDTRHAAAELALSADSAIKELREALEYWLPREEPLRHQEDAPSIEHRRQWRAARSVLTKYQP